MGSALTRNQKGVHVVFYGRRCVVGVVVVSPAGAEDSSPGRPESRPAGGTMGKPWVGAPGGANAERVFPSGTGAGRCPSGHPPANLWQQDSARPMRPRGPQRRERNARRAPRSPASFPLPHPGLSAFALRQCSGLRRMRPGLLSVVRPPADYGNNRSQLLEPARLKWLLEITCTQSKRTYSSVLAYRAALLHRSGRGIGFEPREVEGVVLAAADEVDHAARRLGDGQVAFRLRTLPTHGE